ncbi:hypothetical protein [Nocardia sp. NPDC047648]|uniref:hypothetical protein n=1 Tax=Nocardia sp. NPDC047648 TaxID=3155625 RepID=UPI0033D502F1
MLWQAVQKLLNVRDGPRMNPVQTASVVEQVAQQSERESGDQADRQEHECAAEARVGVGIEIDDGADTVGDSRIGSKDPRGRNRGRRGHRSGRQGEAFGRVGAYAGDPARRQHAPLGSHLGRAEAQFGIDVAVDHMGVYYNAIGLLLE